MNVQKTSLDGVLLITPPTIHEDFRGHNIEIYNKTLYREAGIDVEFIQDDISVSRQHVLRGLHGDQKTWKLVSCLYGSFYLVVANNDPTSKQYRKWTAHTLSDTNRLQVLIPPKFGNGHFVLSDMAMFHYKQNTDYDRSGQFTIMWNDPEFNIWWPTSNPMLSERDAGM